MTRRSHVSFSLIFNTPSLYQKLEQKDGRSLDLNFVSGFLLPFLCLCELGPFKTAERVIKEVPIPCEMRVRFRLTLSVSGEELMLSVAKFGLNHVSKH